MKTKKKLSVVIPAYNEQNTISQIIDKVSQFKSEKLGFSKEIIIVNDASKDETASIVQKKMQQIPELSLITNEENLGKSQSVKKGILATTGELVVIQDADLEYDPEDWGEFLDEFNKNPELDVIYGNRFGKNNKVIYWQNWIGNRGLSQISNFFTTWHNFRVTDMEVCYKMAKGDLFRRLAATIQSESNFGFEPEITAKFAKSGVKLKQIPINYYPRSIAEGKHMNAWKDGFKALGEILRFNLFTRFSE